jgi:hypothetical protein
MAGVYERLIRSAEWMRFKGGLFAEEVKSARSLERGGYVRAFRQRTYHWIEVGSCAGNKKRKRNQQTMCQIRRQYDKREDSKGRQQWQRGGERESQDEFRWL